MGKLRIGVFAVSCVAIASLGGCAGEEDVGAGRGYGGACTTDPECDDGDVCTFDDCAGGTCTHAAISDCCEVQADCATPPTVCFTVMCNTSNNRCEYDNVGGCCSDHDDCDDGNTCTRDHCNPVTGECRLGVPRSCFCDADIECDDGNACTADTCDPVQRECDFAPIAGCCSTNADCADADACTTDICDTSTGTCSTTPVPGCCNLDGDCDDAMVCTLDVCNLTTNTCQANPISNCCTSDAMCNDGGACTTDTCNLTTNRCEFAPVAGCCTLDAQCADTNPCTTNTCVSNSCVSAPVAGCCLNAADCSDSSVCTTESCVANSCVITPVAGCCEDDADCNDSDICTSETCFMNACVYRNIGGCCTTNLDCLDGLACTTDLCVGNTCSYTPVPFCCDTAADCADGNPCTTEACVLTACVYTNICPDAGPPDAGPPDAGTGMDAGTGGTDSGTGGMDSGAGGTDSGTGGMDSGTGGTDGGTTGDGAVGDGAVSMDGAVGDGAIGDGAIGDGATGDGAITDGAITDGALADGAIADGAPADSPSDDSGVGRDAGERDDSGITEDAGTASRRFTFGGGACSATGGGSPASAWPIAFALGLLFFVRRRRRTALAALLAIVAAFVALVPSLAHAEGFRLDRHRMPSLPEDLMWVERAGVRGDRSPFGRIGFDFADDPLVTRDESGDQHEVVVDHQIGIHIAGGVSLFDHLHAAVGLPLYFQSASSVETTDVMSTTNPADWGAGDLALDVRWVTLHGDDAPIELAIAASLMVPIGRSEALAADESLGLVPRVIASRAFPNDRGFASLSLGVALRDVAQYGDLSIGSEFLFALGAQVNIIERVAATAEIAGSTTFTQAFTSEQTPIEGTIGGRYEIIPGLHSGLSVGTGFTQGYGNPDFRLSAMVGYRGPSAPAEPPPPLPPPPPQDTDGDGLLDPVDACPNDPEDADGFEDEDGCPELDNDRDGINDPDDGCPNEPEDADAWEDEDGCPDPDNDADGILDPQDACPEEPEDIDSFEDEDGCPDPDNDGDGILDPVDQCPMEPETVNGQDDEDGCPDLIRVDRETRQIRILEPVYFATNSDRIQRRSFTMLNELAELLKRQPELGRVDVQGHTDSRGRDQHNLRLSERRAQSVMRYMIEQGVSEGRLEAHGYGEERPIAPNETRDGRAQNRRVEFHLVDMAQRVEVPVEPGAPPATANEPVMDE